MLRRSFLFNRSTFVLDAIVTSLSHSVVSSSSRSFRYPLVAPTSSCVLTLCRCLTFAPSSNFTIALSILVPSTIFFHPDSLTILIASRDRSPIFLAGLLFRCSFLSYSDLDQTPCLLPDDTLLLENSSCVPRFHVRQLNSISPCFRQDVFDTVFVYGYSSCSLIVILNE